MLDVMLPGMDGLTLCKHLRDAGKYTPILMLTARDSLNDKIAGLEAGADDYVVKPFSLREVEARLLAMIRRTQVREGTSMLRILVKTAALNARKPATYNVPNQPVKMV